MEVDTMLYGKHVNRYYLKFCYLFIIGIAALLLVDYVQLLIPDSYGTLIDALAEKNLTLELLGQVMFHLLLILIAMFVGRFLWRITIFGLGIRVENDLRKRMFAHMQTLSQEYFSVNKTGAQMSLYTNDLEAIQDCFGFGIVQLVDGVFLGGLAFYKMFALDHVLTLISAIPLVILAVFGVFIERYMDKKYELCEKTFENLSDFSQENFSGISVIKAFVKERKYRKMFAKLNQDQEDKTISFVRASTLLDISIDFILSVVIIIVVGYGSYLVIQTRNGLANFTVGDLSRFISYFSTLTWPMMAIAGLINLISRGRASLRRIGKLLDYVPQVKDIDNPLHKDNFDGEIEFRHLTFTYPDAKNPVLHNVNFTIKPGEMVGVIGATGSGKTTLVDLLTRMYNVNPGELFLDGEDIMNYAIKDVRRAISYVPQDNFLFGTTVINNIGFGRKKITKEEAQHFAKMSDVDDNIEEFQNQYDTILGERGVTLSGGQKQRISIARSLAKDSSILILDDAVSAVDTATEANILNNLSEYHHKKTLIMIAHRVSTIENMDKIILVDNGTVIACGTHEELLANEPKYQQIVRLQHLEDELKGVN
jgi:ATP-binding cassette subfamily B multidrug efflux pump